MPNQNRKIAHIFFPQALDIWIVYIVNNLKNRCLMNRVAPIFLSLFLTTTFTMDALAFGRIFNNNHGYSNQGYNHHGYRNHGYSQYSKFYWQGSTFYQNQYGVIFPAHFNKRSIDKLCGYAAANRMRYFYVMPSGYEGAPPSRWKSYMYHSFARNGIQVVEYRSTRSRSYRHYRNDYHDNNSGFYFKFRF